ncbi:hypothetical protein PCM78_06560 [Staphylococcus aureus]|nr:hypothetical protein PCM78_06560 [Staphylococcus aureus]HDM8844894.1 hypothetical protein [Staphylococcus aureus]
MQENEKILQKVLDAGQVGKRRKMANIAKAKSEIFRNYTLGFATLATMLEIFF